MIAQKSETSIMIVSDSDKASAFFLKLLQGNRFSPIITAASAGEAKRKLVDSSIDIVIVNAPLPDDFGVQLAIDISENATTGVLLTVRSEVYEQVSYKAEEYGILTVARPCTGQTLFQSIKLLIATQAKLKSLREKTMSLEEKMAEIRLVNRAKWLLIDNLKMSESDAHRYIEKVAMDHCVKRRDIANRIIAQYDSQPTK